MQRSPRPRHIIELPTELVARKPFAEPTSHWPQISRASDQDARRRWVDMLAKTPLVVQPTTTTTTTTHVFINEVARRKLNTPEKSAYHNGAPRGARCPNAEPSRDKPYERHICFSFAGGCSHAASLDALRQSCAGATLLIASIQCQAGLRCMEGFVPPWGQTATSGPRRGAASPNALRADLHTPGARGNQCSGGCRRM